MKKFSKMISEASQFRSKQVEEFLVAIAEDKKDFEWHTCDRDFEESIGGGEGDFFTCVKNAKRAADGESMDVIATVSLSCSQLGYDIILQYDPKKKWSLVDF